MKTQKEISYWVAMLLIGFTLGIGAHQVGAWTEPMLAPPGGNLGAPINTGGSDQVKSGGFAVNGGLFLVPNGQVGIGTVSPTQKLDVAGNVKGSQLCIGNDCRGSWPSGGVTSVGTNNGLTGGPITTTGTIGIDTSNISSCTNATTNKLYWNGSKLSCGTDQSGSGGGDNLGNHTATQNLNIGNYKIVGGGTSGLTITNSGIVSIGTKFSVDGTSGNTILWGKLTVQGDGVALVGSGANLNIQGTLQAQGKSELWGFTQIGMNNSGTGLTSPSTGVLDFYANNLFSTRIASNGNVGIGTSNPTYKLTVNGSVGASGFVNTSDIRLKENIAPLQNSLEKILNFRGVSFNWKDKTVSTEKQIGLIAQEVEKVIPELVSTDSNGIKSVNYAAMVAPLIEAVKEQQKEIEDLKAQVETLQNK